MRWLDQIGFHLRSLFRKRKLDEQLSEEVRTHVEMATEANRAGGMTPDEARHAALREFGNVVQIQERARDERGWIWLDHVMRDCRHAGRSLRKSPLATAVIVLSLGLAIGANAVVFAWMQGVVFRPIPGVENAPRFLLFEPRSESGSYPGASWPEYQDLRRGLGGVEELFAFRTLPLNYGQPGQEERAYGQLVSGNYFQALGLKPAMGRLLEPADAAQPGGSTVVVVSAHFWRNHLGADRDVVGREIRLNGLPVTVVGVAADGFEGTLIGLTFDCWLPATLAPVLLRGSTELDSRDARGYSLMGALRPGASRVSVQTEFTATMAGLARASPGTNAAMQGEVLSFWRAPRGAPRFLFGALSALQGFMLLVLFVACANAANLLLARATARQREIGVRLALGARSSQIIQLFVIEGLVLGIAAMAAGSLLAWWGVDALRAVPLPGGLPFRFHTEFDGIGLLFVLGLGLACVLLFAVAPAWRAARTDVQLAWRSTRGATGRPAGRRVLMGLEVALALLVLIVAAMFGRSFLESQVSDPGFRMRGVLLVNYDLAGAGYDWARGVPVMNEMLSRLRSLPGVEQAAIASWVPLDFHAMSQSRFELVGRVRTDGGTDRALSYTVTPGYFATIGLKLVEGRDFIALDDTAGPPEVVVNEEFVRRFGDGLSLVGREVARQTRNFRIVGVVRDALYESFGEPAKAMMYFSYRDRFYPGGQIHVATQGNERALVPAVQRLIRELDPAITLYDVRTLTEHVDKNLFFRKIPARLFAVLGPMVLLLAAVGIYAMVAYATAQRTAEIGVRLALGATRWRVVSALIGETLRTVAWGMVPAWFLAVVVMLHVRGGLLTPSILLGVPAVLFAVATLAAWLPARRAARVDPMVALRTE